MKLLFDQNISYLIKKVNEVFPEAKQVRCLLMVAIGILMLIGGIFIRNYKLWANNLVTIISVGLILMIIGLTIVMAITIGSQEELENFSLVAIISAFVFSTPIALLIWFLKKNKKYFT